MTHPVMAFREITLQEVKEVVRLWRARVPRKRIAGQLGLDVKTVRRYVRALEEDEAGPDLDAATGAIVEAVSSARGRPRGEGWERREGHRAFIKGKLDQRVRLTRVRKLPKRVYGVEVSYMTLYRFAVEELDFGRGASTIPSPDCGPAEEVQLDTGWVGWI
jgi:IS30 family transposase